MMRRALEIFEKSLGPDHPKTQMVRENLAKLKWTPKINVVSSGAQRSRDNWHTDRNGLSIRKQISPLRSACGGSPVEMTAGWHARPSPSLDPTWRGPSLRLPPISHQFYWVAASSRSLSIGMGMAVSTLNTYSACGEPPVEMTTIPGNICS